MDAGAGAKPATRWRGPAAAGALVTLGVALFLAEQRRPLRTPTQPRLSRVTRNLAVAVVAAAAASALERPLIQPLSRRVEARRWGLLQRLPGPEPARLVLGVVLLDYTLYLWHVLLHRWGPLWRMHVAHHADLDLDVSTALRFHFAELAASVPWRAAQVLAIGVGPRTLAGWQVFLGASVLFHHSNVRLPWPLERRLAWILTTPRMHGIHHSTVREETNANWSSGLSLWDRLHGTFRLDVPQDAIEIGVPAFRDPRRLTLAHALALPFRRQPPTWRDPLGRVVRRGPAHSLMKEVA